MERTRIVGRELALRTLQPSELKLVAGGNGSNWPFDESWDDWSMCNCEYHGSGQVSCDPDDCAPGS